jgi:ABC-type multidrug transport system ATPase subunit
MEYILKVDNLSFTSKKRKILDNVSFNVPTNSICAFIGPNGAGKTTTIKCITNLYPVYKGSVYMDGLSNKNIKSFESLGYVPEKENFPKLKVRDFL